MLANVNKDDIIYYPNTVYRYLIICGYTFIVILVGLFIITFKNNGVVENILFSILMLGFIVLVKVSYELAKIKVIFQTDCLKLTDRNSTIICSKSYDEIQYAYYCRSYKAHLYLVLSSTPLEKRQIKKIVNQGSTYEKIHYNGKIVMRIKENEEETEMIDKLIRLKIKHVRAE